MGFLKKQQQVFGYKLLKLPSHMPIVKANVQPAAHQGWPTLWELRL